METVSISRLVEMVVYCPDWREKEAILERHIKLLVRQERIDQIRQELDKIEEDEPYET